MKLTNWIGVDLDGTLAKHEEGATVATIGKPITLMLARVMEWLEIGYEVKIVTARVAPEWDDAEDQKKMIQDWCKKWLGRSLEVRCHKDGGMIALYDDRAVGVRRNTGQLVVCHLPGCVTCFPSDD